MLCRIERIAGMEFIFNADGSGSYLRCLLKTFLKCTNYSYFTLRFAELSHGGPGGLEPPVPEEESTDAAFGANLTETFTPLFQRVSITGEEDTGGVSSIDYNRSTTRSPCQF